MSESCKTCKVLSIPLFSSSRTKYKYKRAPLICILPCLTLPAEDFFDLLLCCSSGVKVNGECAARADTKDGKRVVQWHEKWHYNTEVQKFALQINCWTYCRHKSGSQSQDNYTPAYHYKKVSWLLLSFPFTQSNFTNIIAWEQLRVITKSRQQYLPWQDPNINLSGI